MPTITIANFLALCDSLAQQARTVNDAFAAGAIAAGEPISGTGLGAGPANNISTILGANDVDVAAELAPAFRQQIAAGTAVKTLYNSRLAALAQHTGGIASFLAANNARVAPQFRDLVAYVPPSAVFPPAVDPVATFAVTGSGAGTYTHVAGVDTTKYGAAALQLVATDTIGANAITATLTLTTLAGASVVRTVNVPANTVNGTAFAVDGGAISYVDCSAITIAGGTNGDQFKVRSMLERTIAL